MKKALLNWYGGKFGIRKWVLEHLAKYPHNIYVEPFGGGASVLLAKEPIRNEVYNDLDGRLVDFFKVISDEKLFQKFHRIISVLPYSRQLFNEYKQAITKEQDIVRRAAMFFLLVRQSFAGNASNWGYSLDSKSILAWINTVDSLPYFCNRLRNVTIEHKPAIKVIDAFDSQKTLFYIDPPYIFETRKKSDCYDFEMTDDDHTALVNRLLTLKGAAVLSAYEHDIYRPLLDVEWQISRKEVLCRAAGRLGSVLQRRTECLYFSPQKVKNNKTFFES